MRVGKNVEHLKEAGRLAGTKNVDPVLRYVPSYTHAISFHFFPFSYIYPTLTPRYQPCVITNMHM